MTIDVLNKLVASGKAQYGTYVATGGLVVIKVPDQCGMIITGITLRAFADLRVGERFDNFKQVSEAIWHQLRVIGVNGINAFQTRHELRAIPSGGTTFYIPQGFTHWDVFLNHENDVILELVNVGRFMLGAVVVSGTLPAEITRPNNPQPPGGYGKTGVPGSLSSVVSLTVAASWQTKPYNLYTPSNPPGIDSRNQFVVPTRAGTNLELPQPGLQHGIFTIPIIEVDYVLFNKDPNITFSPPIAI